MSESDTLPKGGTDNAFSEADTPETWDYFDPDEEDTEEVAEEEGTDEGPVEGEEAQETDDQPEDEAEPEKSDKPVLVTLDGGEQVTLDDLKKGYLRQADFTRKTQDLSNRRTALEADVQRLEGITQAFIDHLSSMVPAEPNPALALTDPNRYTAQKAQYDAAVAQVQKLIEIGSKPKEITDARTKEQHQERVTAENQSLAAMFPKTATPEGRQAFFQNVSEVARNVGFTDQEIRSVIDHRVFALAHWAKLGMEAEKAKAKAMVKVEKAPPATPRKPGQQAAKANRNVEAMRRLHRTGSIHDAVNVDFD